MFTPEQAFFDEFLPNSSVQLMSRASYSGILLNLQIRDNVDSPYYAYNTAVLRLAGISINDIERQSRNLCIK